FGRLSPHRLVELNVVAAGRDDFPNFFHQYFCICTAKCLLVGVEVRALVDAEAGQHVRAGDGLFDATTWRSCTAGELPITRQVEARILDFADHSRALDAEARGAEGLLEHAFESDSVEALLIEVVHVFAIALAVGDDVETEFSLVASRPFY